MPLSERGKAERAKETPAARQKRLRAAKAIKTRQQARTEEAKHSSKATGLGSSMATKTPAPSGRRDYVDEEVSRQVRGIAPKPSLRRRTIKRDR